MFVAVAIVTVQQLNLISDPAIISFPPRILSDTSLETGNHIQV